MRHPRRRPVAPADHRVGELRVALKTRFFLRSALGSGHDLESFIWDGFAALDRQSVGALSKSVFGTLDSRQIDAQVVGETFVQLGFSQVRSLISHVLIGRRRLVARLWRIPAEASLDPFALAGK
jgi:hypothetical protein